MKSTNKIVLTFVTLSLSVFALTIWTLKPYGGWTHLELGAGNYGAAGHTQISLKQTVLTKLEASSKPNFIDKLPLKDEKPYDPRQQFSVLFWTLDEMVKRHGPKGVFHVNDLLPSYAQVAADALSDYAETQGYNQVQIEVIGGDYNFINAEHTLKRLKLKRYDSVHLKNPEISFFTYKLDGNEVISSPDSRRQGRMLLQKFANLSRTGLIFFALKGTRFIPEEEMKEFIEKEIFYKKTDEWEPVPYYFPEGKFYPKDVATVFFIPPKFA